MAVGKGTPTAEKGPDKRPPWWKRLWGWTGFGKKKLWNWLELLGALAIPLVVAVAAASFSAQQSAIQTQIEEERAQDAALQAYFDQMSTLLLQRDLRFSTEDDATEDSKEARILARARTLTVLGRLDSNRKTEVMQFLVEAELVQGEGEEEAVISLEGAKLRDAELSGANLAHTTLDHASLSNADLGNTNLDHAVMGNADLTGADLSNANLRDVDLGSATLWGAGLSNADLTGASGITYDKLKEEVESLQGATLPNGQRYED